MLVSRLRLCSRRRADPLLFASAPRLSSGQRTGIGFGVGLGIVLLLACCGRYLVDRDDRKRKEMAAAGTKAQAAENARDGPAPRVVRREDSTGQQTIPMRLVSPLQPVQAAQPAPTAVQEAIAEQGVAREKKESSSRLRIRLLLSNPVVF